MLPGADHPLHWRCQCSCEMAVQHEHPAKVPHTPFAQVPVTPGRSADNAFAAIAKIRPTAMRQGVLHALEG